MANLKKEADFLLFPSMPFWLRALFSFVLLLFIYTFQLAGLTLIWIALFVILALLNWVRAVEVKRPDFLPQQKDWKEVTEREFELAIEKALQVRKWRASLKKKFTFAFIGLTLFWIVGIGFLTSSPSAAAWIFADRGRAYLLVDLVLLLFFAFLTGNRKIWEPEDLAEKLTALKVAWEQLKKMKEPERTDSIQFLIRKARKGFVPVDARIFCSFPKAGKGFYGVQIQVSINKVQNRKYPYLYAVLVAEAGFGLNKGSEGDGFPSWLLREYKKEKDVEIIVLRQRTTKSSGYHTPESRIKEIVDWALLLAKKILKLNTPSV